MSQHTPDDNIKFDEGHIEIDFSSSQKVLRELIQKVIDNGFPEGVDILNLNVPADPDSYEPKICPLATRMYEPVVEMRIDPRGRPYYWIDGLDMAHDLDALNAWYDK